MRHVTVLALVAVSLVTAPACKRARPPGRANPAPVAATAAAAALATTPELRTLSGRLAFEAAHRPAGAARVEDVLAAAARAGVVVDDVKQYLALTAAASYCAGGRTADGLAVAVCEYADAATAQRGKDHVTTAFAAMAADREILIHGATTLTTSAPAGRDLTATRTALARAFTTL